MKLRDLIRPRAEGTYTAEGGGWLVYRRSEPALARATPAELLAQGAKQAGNLRYVIDPRRGVLLTGEVRGLDGLTVDEARARLDAMREGPAELPVPADEVIEAALEASGLAWSRRDTAWAVPANEILPRELKIRSVPGGVKLEAVLAEWDEIMPECGEALARFLVAAQAGLRGARCEMDATTARVTALVGAEQIDSDFVHALMGVAAGCRLLARQAVALLLPDMARAYLAFHREPGAAEE
ncbi:MAG TPA: hypothetical protein VJ739_06650 [Gemmataceae bacterium]|nr:hypothetical protein [Gemmataceae bacterium]